MTLIIAFKPILSNPKNIDIYGVTNAIHNNLILQENDCQFRDDLCAVCLALTRRAGGMLPVFKSFRVQSLERSFYLRF